MTRKGILDAAEACVCGQREQDYGSPEDNFRTIAELWRQYIQARCVGPGVLVDLIPEDVAAMMILLKVGRIAGGSASQDNWVDIAGYAACGGEIATKGAAEALREPDEPFKNGRSQEHFEELRNLISDMSVVEIASHIETDNLSEYLGIWRYHAQKELLSIRQLFLEEDNPMSMPREEAITLLKYRRNIISSVDVDWNANEIEAINFALSALRPVSREQIEQVWRGCEYCSGDVDNRSYLDSKRLYLDGNGILTDEIENIDILRLDFCPICGKPLTDEAVEMVMERLEALNEKD